MNNYPESVIQMRDVSKRFGKINAVDNVSLDVPKGAIFGFIGPVAAARQPLYVF